MKGLYHRTIWVTTNFLAGRRVILGAWKHSLRSKNDALTLVLRCLLLYNQEITPFTVKIDPSGRLNDVGTKLLSVKLLNTVSTDTPRVAARTAIPTDSFEMKATRVTTLLHLKYYTYNIESLFLLLLSLVNSKAPKKKACTVCNSFIC